MRYVLLALSLLLFAPVAHAGSITITFTAAGACAAGCAKSYTETDANLAKIITAYAPLCMAQNMVQGADPAVAPVATACTAGQTLNYWRDGLIKGTAANVTSFMQQQAVQALPTITPINPQ